MPQSTCPSFFSGASDDCWSDSAQNRHPCDDHDLDCGNDCPRGHPDDGTGSTGCSDHPGDQHGPAARVAHDDWPSNGDWLTLGIGHGAQQPDLAFDVAG